MTLTEDAQAELDTWLDQYTQALEDLKAQAAAAADAAWMSFSGWYDTAAVATVATEMAALSRTAQQTTVGMAAQYVETVMAVLNGRPLTVPAPNIPTIRNGVDLQLVHTRPAEAYRRSVATGGSEADALTVATQRASGLVLTDVSLVSRETEQDYYAAAGIKGYRRVIRPELSASGSCGLCVAASDRIYNVGDLLPIHPPHCKCTTMPITATDDPGIRINQADLKALYAAVGSTAAKDLTSARFKVDEHGELGPMLTRKGDSFRSQKKVALEDDPARARRMLDQVRPVLVQLQERAAAGEDVTGPLTYQRGLAARLERIAA